VHRDVQKTNNVQNERGNKDFWGQGYSDKLLTILCNVHSFYCLLQAAKDGIFKNSNVLIPGVSGPLF